MYPKIRLEVRKNIYIQSIVDGNRTSNVGRKPVKTVAYRTVGGPTNSVGEIRGEGKARGRMCRLNYRYQ